MSDDSEIVETSVADGSDGSVVTEFTDVIPHGDYHTPQFIEQVVEVVPDCLQDVKEEPADELEAHYYYYYYDSAKV